MPDHNRNAGLLSNDNLLDLAQQAVRPLHNQRRHTTPPEIRLQLGDTNIEVENQVNSEEACLLNKNKQENSEQAHGIQGTNMCKSFCLALLPSWLERAWDGTTKCTPNPQAPIIQRQLD